MTDTTPKIDSELDSKSAKKSSGYLSVLVILMMVAGLIGGIYGFAFGKRSLEGVNPVPLGSKNLKLVPASPKPSAPKSGL